METKPTPLRPEKVFTLQPAWRSYFVFYAAILIFGLGPSINPEAGISTSLGLVISIFLTLFVIFRRRTTFYHITKDEVLRESGFFGQVTKKSLPFDGITGLEVRRGVIHRLLGIGHLQFRSRNQAQPDLWWFGIQDPFTAQKNIQRFIK
jgi:uncharacterized membrane protein YdbT with pleckstrin-like domain